MTVFVTLLKAMRLFCEGNCGTRGYEDVVCLADEGPEESQSSLLLGIHHVRTFLEGSFDPCKEKLKTDLLQEVVRFLERLQ